MRTLHAGALRVGFDTTVTVASRGRCYKRDMERLAVTRHPLGSRARVLLTSVFGPYARDDAHGSRAINPMELYHNQVTRVQGPFSLRMFHRSWGLMLIQANLEAPTTLLDFPTLERFDEEIRTVPYDVVGISGILPNIGKVKLMCEIVRRHQPKATIVVGGHIANRPGLREVIDADHVVAGEGVAWFRAFLGEDASAPVRHPQIVSAFGARTMGVPFGQGEGETAATVIPSVGCPLGCNFCSTSAMFGGKGRSFSFYESGDELFEVMWGLEQALDARAFFVMDENFLLHRKRALRLLEMMREHGKAWALYVFSSANALRQYTDDELVGLGISWVWLGLEGEESAYAKLKGTDTRGLVRRLQALGIRVLGSTIVGPRRARRRQHRPRDRPRGRARHRVPPVHALHAGARHAAPRRAPEKRHAPLHRGVPGRRHPRTAALQLPPPAHPERRGDGVPAAGLPPRLRGERTRASPASRARSSGAGSP